MGKFPPTPVSEAVEWAMEIRIQLRLFGGTAGIGTRQLINRKFFAMS